MNRKKILIGSMVILAVLLGIWLQMQKPRQIFLSKGQKVENSSKQSLQTNLPSIPATTASIARDQVVQRKAVVEKIQNMLATPILFYGKVIDQNGDPVASAEIGYSALDKFDASGSNYTGRADKEGFFSITDIRGAVLTVVARKKNYYHIQDVSNQSFAYGIGPDSNTKPPPTKENPAVFVLQKMGETEPLIYAGTCYYKVTKDGQAMEVNLETGKQVPGGQGNIQFQRWANDQAKDEKGNFDWRFKITVPNGGLVERQDQFAFEAPQEGYQNVVEINMPASLGEKWQYTVNKSYFVKLSDGHYARINATIQAGHNNTPLILDAFVNSQPNSRNLEYDPNKTVNTEH